MCLAMSLLCMICTCVFFPAFSTTHIYTFFLFPNGKKSKVEWKEMERKKNRMYMCIWCGGVSFWDWQNGCAHSDKSSSYHSSSLTIYCIPNILIRELITINVILFFVFFFFPFWLPCHLTHSSVDKPTTNSISINQFSVRLANVQNCQKTHTKHTNCPDSMFCRNNVKMCYEHRSNVIRIVSRAINIGQIFSSHLMYTHNHREFGYDDCVFNQKVYTINSVGHHGSPKNKSICKHDFTARTTYE